MSFLQMFMMFILKGVARSAWRMGLIDSEQLERIRDRDRPGLYLYDYPLNEVKPNANTVPYPHQQMGH